MKKDNILLSFQMLLNRIVPTKSNILYIPTRKYRKHFITHRDIKRECKSFSKYMVEYSFNDVGLHKHFQTISNLIDLAEKHRQSYHLLKIIDRAFVTQVNISGVTCINTTTLSDIKKLLQRDNVFVNRELIDFAKNHKYSNKRVYKKLDKFVYDFKKENGEFSSLSH